MGRQSTVLKRFGTLALIFVIGTLAISWPMLAAPGQWTLSDLFGFLFLAWVTLVAVLYLVGRSVVKDAQGKGDV
jgi:hypothetical protein